MSFLQIFAILNVMPNPTRTHDINSFSWPNGMIGLLVVTTGDYTPDMRALLGADVIICTPEKWDGISRNWQNRAYVKKVALLVIDEIHLLGADRCVLLKSCCSFFFRSARLVCTPRGEGHQGTER